MNDKTHRRKLNTFWVGCALVVAFLTALIGISISEFNRYTQKQIYQESISQLTEISDQLFEKLEVQLNDQWDRLYKLEQLQNGRSEATVAELADFLTSRERDLSPANSTVRFLAVDQHGYYYTAEGQQGLWTGAELLDDSDQQSFLITDWLTNTNQIVFAYRLQSPLIVNGSSITHFVLLRSMEDIAPFFRCSAFHNQNTTYVLDANGVKMFEDTVLPDTTFSGRNLYHALRQLTYPHSGKTFDQYLEKLDREGFVCTSVLLSNEQDYYMALKRLDGYSWTMVFFVPQDEVAVSTRSMVNSLLQIFIGAIIILILVSCLAMLVVMRLRQNQRTLAERERVNTQLEAANAQLETANEQLEHAQQATVEALSIAERANQAKTDFLSNMSHDIRTPMNAIVGIAQLMQSELNDPQKMADHIEKLQASSQHLLNIINDVLDMSRIESGKAVLHTKPMNLAEELNQIESIIRPQTVQNGQTFDLHTDGVRHEQLLGDATRLRQVLLNILSNAVKYTPEGGHIHFCIKELERDGRTYARYRFAVEDTGIGMTPEFLEHIFDPFTRAENSVTNRVQGTGLGMAITKNIVEMMGGSIHVESTLGKGTRFEVMLEFKIDPDAAANTEKLSLLALHCDGRHSAAIRDALTDRPVVLHIADTLADGLAVLRNNHVDVILLPYTDDLDALSVDVHTLRDAAPSGSMLLCVAERSREEVLTGLHSVGADGFLPLPFFATNLDLEMRRVREGRIQTAGEEHSSILKGMHFLCAEDNAINAEILRSLLELSGADCTIYSDGAQLVQAFAAVEPGQYDMILMDVQMPVMNGYEATKAIRAGENPLGRTIPILAMTANAFSEDVQHSLDAGMDAHLSKPVDLHALEDTIRKFRVPPPRKQLTDPSVLHAEP